MPARLSGPAPGANISPGRRLVTSGISVQWGGAAIVSPAAGDGAADGVPGMAAGADCPGRRGGVRDPLVPPLREKKYLAPAVCGLWAAASGLAWALLKVPVPTRMYLLSLAAAPGGCLLFRAYRDGKDPVIRWILQGMGVLALSQVLPEPWLGILAAGILAQREGFHGAVLGGLALDLARVSPVPMTAVVCLGWMTRMIPGREGPWRWVFPAAGCLAVMWLTGETDWGMFWAFSLAAPLARCLPAVPDTVRRRGPTGMAQVRLEMMAGVLDQTRELWLQQREEPIDEGALLAKTRERACGACPNRKSCPRLGQIPRELLHVPWTENGDLPFPCRKPGRMILELRRTQEHYRRLKADRDRNREYRRAVIQQYGFLADYLKEQADVLADPGEKNAVRFRPEAGWATRSRERENGDKLVHFPGPEGGYFLILCDGMGTGLGAAGESDEAVKLLKWMLCAGFPPEHALESLNSLLTLTGKSGAVSVDLVQIRLDSGKTALYKWGAPESYLVRAAGAEKIGTAGPPPGIGVSDNRMTVQRLSLGRGEALILVSDGVDAQQLKRCAAAMPGSPPGEMAARILELSTAEGTDDATVAVVRLCTA